MAHQHTGGDTSVSPDPPVEFPTGAGLAAQYGVAADTPSYPVQASLSPAPPEVILPPAGSNQPVTLQVPIPKFELVHVPQLDEAHASRLQQCIFVGTLGKIRAYEASSLGAPKILWTDELKGAGSRMVASYLHAPTGRLFAFCNGFLLCIDALTGKRIWEVRIPNQYRDFEADLVTLWSDGAILVAAVGLAVHAVHAASGDDIWRFRVEIALLDPRLAPKIGPFTIIVFKNLLILGHVGFVYAFDIPTFRAVWNTELKGLGSVTLAAYTHTQPDGSSRDVLLAGRIGYVFSLDLDSGLVRQSVKVTGGQGYFAIALLADPASDAFCCASHGEIRCLRSDNFNALWKSDLPGMGYARGQSLTFSDNTVILGMQGYACALDKASGREVWKTSLPGCRYTFVTVGMMRNPHQLICASYGQLYGVDRTSGQVLWQDGMSGMGYGAVTVCTADLNTDFNSSTLPQFIELNSMPAMAVLAMTKGANPGQ